MYHPTRFPSRGWNGTFVRVNVFRSLGASRRGPSAVAAAASEARHQDVGAWHAHLYLEAARPKQRGVDELRPIGEADDEHVVELLDAVQLGEQLVEPAQRSRRGAGGGHAAARGQLEAHLQVRTRTRSMRSTRAHARAHMRAHPPG